MGDCTSYGSMSFRLGSNARVTCHTYPDNGPILSLSAGDWSLSMSPAGRTAITDGDVAKARRLAEAVTTYLAECERLHAEQATQTDADTSTAVA